MQKFDQLILMFIWKFKGHKKAKYSWGEEGWGIKVKDSHFPTEILTKLKYSRLYLIKNLIQK